MFAQYIDTHAHAHTHERTHAMQHILLHPYTNAHVRVHEYTRTHTHTHTHTLTDVHQTRAHTHVRSHAQVLSPKSKKMPLQTPRSGSKYHPKASPETTREQTNTRTVFETQKLIFLAALHASKKICKFDLQTTPRRAETKTLYHVHKNMKLGTVWNPQDKLFGNQNESNWNTFRRI